MILTENPAYRLHEIMKEVYTITSPNNVTISYRDLWAKVFNFDPTNNDALLDATHSLLKLYLEVKDRIINNEMLNDEMNLRHLKKLEVIVMRYNLETNFNKAHLSTDTMTALHYINKSFALVYGVEQTAISKETQSELLEEVRSLIDNIATSELPVDIKEILIRNMSNIQESLVLYKVSGAEGMRQALESTIGSIMLNRKQIESTKENPDVKSFLAFIGKTITIIESVNSIKELASPIISVLLGGGE
ncbi:hypothetical protein ACQCU1_14625 [Sutcliffiella horikoshii]|uniref:hypothetical protein n=1 Tax=Sutcliffiella horikoshii TaxID=79883 RepID=UPI003CFB83FC